jgi:hypothetical protein
MSDLAQDLEYIAIKITEIVDGFGADESISAWDLKLKLRVGLSPLYMALGMLKERGQIRILPDGLTFRIQTGGIPKSSQPIVGIPIEITVPDDEAAAVKNS